MEKKGYERVERNNNKNESNYKDLGFAIAFGVNVLLILFLGIFKGTEALKDVHVEMPSIGPLYLVLMSILLASVFIAIAWMKVLIQYAETIIHISLWGNVCMMVLGGIASMASNPYMPFMFLIGAGISVCYIMAVKNRIAFSSANLKCACGAIREYTNIVWLAVFMVVLQLVWMAIWALGTIGVYQILRQEDPDCKQLEQRGRVCGGNWLGVSIFGVLLSLYWGQQVLVNVLACTTSGTVASWWYGKQGDGIVGGAFKRSMTTSFGSICFGSLLVAVVSALRTCARMLRDQAREDRNEALAIVACLAECMLSILESALEYINQWAFCYIGIYGFDFKASGSAVMALFKSRGWTAIINDNLSGTALGFGSIAVGCASCAMGVVVAAIIPNAWTAPLAGTDKYVTIAAFSFIAGLTMASIVASVINTALHTIFVCFAEDPTAFSRSHPRHHQELTQAWQKFHPHALAPSNGQYTV